MSAAQDAIKTFNQQWYNALVSQANLNPETFQLAQGSIYLGVTSDKIWQFFNSIPSDSDNNIYNYDPDNNFAETYGAVVNNLLPQSGDAEQEALGDQYADWIAFKTDRANTSKITDVDYSDLDSVTKANLELFNRFAFMNGISQNIVEQMNSLLSQKDVVLDAITLNLD